MLRHVQIRRRPAGEVQAQDMHPVLARILGARGLTEAPDYSLATLLPPTLGGLDAATALLADAIRQQQRIVVVGDFDADGATGTALAVRALRALGANHVDWVVPDRFSPRLWPEHRPGRTKSLRPVPTCWSRSIRASVQSTAWLWPDGWVFGSSLPITICLDKRCRRPTPSSIRTFRMIRSRPVRWPESG